MLRQINIENFAIIEKMNINFNEGLTVITGQTGAGKSIVIDAIEQILGTRASSSIIGPKGDTTFIEGIFDLNDDVDKLLKDNNVDLEEDYIIISKRIKSDGKSQLRLNNRIVTNDLIRQLSSHLLEIHSQHSTYEITDQTKQQELIDSYFNDKENKILVEYQTLFKEYNNALNEKDELVNNTIDPELLSFYSDQLKDINDNNINEEELKDLMERENVLKDFEKIYSSFEQILGYLNNSNTLDNLHQVAIEFEKLTTIKDSYESIASKANELYYETIDLKEEITSEFNSLSFDEGEYEEIRSRLFNYNKMIKKYSYSQEEVQEKVNDLEAKIDFINNSDSLVTKLDNKIKEYEDKLIALANNLTKIRQKYIKELEEQIVIQLNDLYLKDAKFKVNLESTNLTKYGLDRVQFLFSANKGSSLYPISQVASGGELSRFMLALKTVSLAKDKMYIFDEIDTGVSGEVANAIGVKIKELSRENNIICITHLPQVAVYAKNHLYIEKSTNESFTTSNCYYLNEDDEIKEIAKMLSGDKISDTAIIHAKELKEIANNA